MEACPLLIRSGPLNQKNSTMNKLQSLGILSTLVVSSLTASAGFTTIDMSAQANANLAGTLINGGTFPSGAVNLGSVPFSIPAIAGNNYWNSYFAGGLNPRQVDVPVSIFGVTEVNTLMSTFWGETASGTLSAIEFTGTGGAFLHVDLDGDSDIRDYNQAIWANSINGTTTTEVFNNGFGQRLDKQEFNLPASFATETLTNVRFIDNGADGVHRLFVAGLTVSTPDPVGVPDGSSTVALLGVSSLILLGASRRMVRPTA